MCRLDEHILEESCNKENTNVDFQYGAYPPNLWQTRYENEQTIRFTPTKLSTIFQTQPMITRQIAHTSQCCSYQGWCQRAQTYVTKSITKPIETAGIALHTIWTPWRHPWYPPSSSSYQGLGGRSLCALFKHFFRIPDTKFTINQN